MEIKSLPVQNEDGDLVPGASATIYHLDSGEIATIYNGDGAVISNPITAGADGIIEFSAENGPYRVMLTIGIQQYERFLYFSDIKEHNDDPAAHPALSAFITEEADRAEAAADAAELNAGIYADTAAGLAATTEGDYFSVPSAEDDEYLILYLHEAGPTATEIKRYPSADGIDKAIQSTVAALTEGEIEEPADGSAIRDSVTGKELLGFNTDGRARLSEGFYFHKISISEDDPVVDIIKFPINDTSFHRVLGVNTRTGEVIIGALDEASKQRLGIGQSTGSAGISNVSSVIDYHPSSGQSLDVGGGLDRDATDTPVLTTTPPTPFSVMFNTGVCGLETSALNDASLVDFVPLIEAEGLNDRGIGETQGAGDAWQSYTYQLRRGALAYTLCRTHGAGGLLLSQLEKGTVPYSNGLKEITRAVAIAANKGMTIRAPLLGWTHGESDRGDGTSKGDYKTGMIQLRADYNADWLPIIQGQDGQEGHPEIGIMMQQLAANAADNQDAGAPALAQYELARDEAGFYLVMPQYIMRNDLVGDGTHRTAHDYRVMGAYRAKAWDRIVNEGSFAPMIPTSISRVGTTITITCGNAVGDLSLDTDTVPENTTFPMGFEYDGANITDVQVSGKSVTITIDADAGGTLRYAYTTSGATVDRPSAWGNVRDNDFEPCLPDPTLLLWNWLPVLEEVIA